MANIVWHEKWKIELDLTREDLGHESKPGLWELLYRTDRMDADRGVPVSGRGLQCGGVCRKAGVVAWMHLRERNGRREAVHERSEDEERHRAPMSDEHKAYQERIVRTAEGAGFRADSEVRTSVGPRSWIQTDTLVQGEGGLRIGWEVQLSSAGVEGPRSVKARAGKAAKYGITPAWHTDRADYATRNDTQWTRSNWLPAHVIAKSGDLRVVSGFRLLDFWRCDVRALYRCPDTSNRCGTMHVTPKVRDVFFDDLVRRTAAGTIVPIELRVGSRTQRFWVPEDDRNRLDDFNSGKPIPPAADPEGEQRHRSGSHRAPTCRPSAPDADTGVVPPIAIPSIPIQPSPRTTPQPAAFLAPSAAAGPVVPRQVGPDERAAVASELGCPAWELGPCSGCGQLMRRYGYNAAVACASCRSLASSGSVRLPRTG